MARRADPAAARVLAERWAATLAEWAIPEDVLAAAPESPWGFPTDVFRRAAEEAVDDPVGTPSRRRALDALGSGGTVLDVGAGGGAASLPLAAAATRLVAVDESPDMLEAFAASAAGRGIGHGEIAGRWPEVAAHAPVTDVVVCHHVVYNVPDIAPFLDELTRHARRRVVVELTARHPQSDLNALWRAIHGIDRPDRPVADDVVDLLAAMGVTAAGERFSSPSMWSRAGTAERVAFARRRLCVGPGYDEEIERLLPSADRRMVTLWWDGGADGGPAGGR